MNQNKAIISANGVMYTISFKIIRHHDELDYEIIYTFSKKACATLWCKNSIRLQHGNYFKRKIPFNRIDPEVVCNSHTYSVLSYHVPNFCLINDVVNLSFSLFTDL